jgi:CRP/FNR family transcriptional regulator
MYQSKAEPNPGCTYRGVARNRKQVVECDACGLFGMCKTVGMDGPQAEIFDAVVSRCEPVGSQQSLLTPRSPASEIIAVKSGSFKASVEMANGEQKIVGFFLPGELIGLEGLGQGRYPYTVEALEDASVCRLDLTQLEQLAIPREPFQWQLINALSDYAAHKQWLALLMGAQSAEQRLALFLLSLSERFAEHQLPGLSFKLPMSRNDIANYLGLAVETVSRMVQRLQTMEILEVHGRQLALYNHQSLRAMAGVV